MFSLTLSVCCPLRFLNKASHRFGIIQSLILEVSFLLLSGCKVLLVQVFLLSQNQHCDVKAVVCQFFLPSFVIRK